MKKIILNGSEEARKIFKSLKYKTINQKSKISLATILIGNNPASEIYVNIKNKKAKELGINFKKYLLPGSVSQEKIINLINKLNHNKNIHGILVQLPLPKKFNKNSINEIIKKINIKKDVDGFVSKKTISPTIQAVIHLIKLSRIKLINKKAVILANSTEFAEPLKNKLKKKKIKVNIILKNKINDYGLQITHYDLIIIALGKKHWLKPKMIKKDSIIIDVGINRLKNSSKIYGDVHPNCFKKSKYISPVPGGVGPLTVAFLFKNLVKLYKNTKIDDFIFLTQKQ